MSNLATSVATGAAASSLSQGDIDLSKIQIPGEKEKAEKASPQQKLSFLLTFVLAGATGVSCIVAAAVAAAAAVPSTAGVIISAAVVGIGDSCYVGVQRVQLVKMATLRQVMNKLRAEVYRLRGINKELKEQNDLLKVQVGKVKEIEKGLSNIVTRQGKSVEDFVAAVKANQEVLDQMENLIKAQLLQNIVTIVLRADRDRNSTLDPDEVDMLINFLKAQEGITLNEERFMAKLDETGYTMKAVLAVCRELVHQKVADDDHIIKVNPKEMRL